TTISPYLFIWQSSLEGERARGLPSVALNSPARIAVEEADRIRVDTCFGMAVAGLIAFAVIMTAAATLHSAGITQLQTTAEAAEALRPALGPFAHLAFSIGILATGLLAVPMLIGSAAYAFAESRNRPAGLGCVLGDAPAFYGCILFTALAGITLNFAGIDPIKALIWSADANGLVAVPVLALMMRIGTNPAVMGRFALRGPLAILGWLTTLCMGAGAVGLLLTQWW
ncbi:MAG: divalent metal cation transporter, partial [Acetobacteraceae bacterium]|nr:divalent metal cation transporter [Acetobacteraceae bacterium]